MQQSWVKLPRNLVCCWPYFLFLLLILAFLGADESSETITLACLFVVFFLNTISQFLITCLCIDSSFRISWDFFLIFSSEICVQISITGAMSDSWRDSKPKYHFGIFWFSGFGKFEKSPDSSSVPSAVCYKCSDWLTASSFTLQVCFIGMFYQQW